MNSDDWKMIAAGVIVVLMVIGMMAAVYLADFR